MTSKNKILPVAGVLLFTGAIGGGIITYSANSEQKAAVAVGFASIPWTTEVVTGKVAILGLSEAQP